MRINWSMYAHCTHTHRFHIQPQFFFLFYFKLLSRNARARLPSSNDISWKSSLVGPNCSGIRWCTVGGLAHATAQHNRWNSNANWHGGRHTILNGFAERKENEWEERNEWKNSAREIMRCEISIARRERMHGKLRVIWCEKTFFAVSPVENMISISLTRCVGQIFLLLLLLLLFIRRSDVDCCCYFFIPF